MTKDDLVAAIREIMQNDAVVDSLLQNCSLPIAVKSAGEKAFLEGLSNRAVDTVREALEMLKSPGWFQFAEPRSQFLYSVVLDANSEMAERTGGKISISTVKEVFQRLVLDPNDFVWFVDHFTTDAPQFNVKYFSLDPDIAWTNENIFQGDGSHWDSEDVSSWFSDGRNTYRHVLVFSADAQVHKLTLEPGIADLDGKSVWTEYCEGGIKGAIGAFLDSFQTLISVEIARKRKQDDEIPKAKKRQE